MTFLDQNIDPIKQLCEKHKVANLYAFGSVVTNNFKSSSDIDLLVEFTGVELLDYADNYFEFKQALEKLLDRPIDLLEEQALKNPYLRQSIEISKQKIYGRGN